MELADVRKRIAPVEEGLAAVCPALETVCILLHALADASLTRANEETYLEIEARLISQVRELRQKLDDLGLAIHAFRRYLSEQPGSDKYSPLIELFSQALDRSGEAADLTGKVKPDLDILTLVCAQATMFAHVSQALHSSWKAVSHTWAVAASRPRQASV